MASFVIVLCLGSLIAFAIVMGGGKYRRETGWPFVAALLTLVSVVEFIIISIVVRRDKSVLLQRARGLTFHTIGILVRP